MKKTWWIIITFMVIAMILISGKTLFKRGILKSYDVNTELTLGENEYRYNSAKFTKDEVIKIDEYFQMAQTKVDSLFSLDNDDKLEIILPYENGISVTYPTLNLMVLHYTNIKRSPIVHEYIHQQLGIYKEEWFTEGFATYVSLYLKKKNSILREHIDIGDQWFEIEDFKKVPINELTREYVPSKTSIDLLNLSNDTIKRDRVARKAFYMASTSFIEHLVDKHGLSKLIDAATSTNGLTNSIEKEFEKRNISVDLEIENWILRKNTSM